MDRPDVRASDAERERAVGVLRDAAAEGRLTFEELADRIAVASEATTRGELERVTADLPVPAPVPQAVAAVKASSSSATSACARGGCARSSPRASFAAPRRVP